MAATYEVLEVAGRPAVLQEWLTGVPGGDWPPLAAAPGVWFCLVSQAALALQAVHTAGLAHGRIGPSSFVFTAGGALKLCGLGEPVWLADPDADAPPPAGREAAPGDDLDLDAMRQACVPLLGEHDFAAFCRRPKPVPGAATPPTTVRRVLAADWSHDGEDRLRFAITATAFCHQMVRSVVGTLVAVGRGALHASDVAGILRGRDRQRCPDVAPPHGLCLWEVGYEGLPRSTGDQ